MSQILNEVPAGSINGSNVNFTVQNTPAFLTLQGQVLTAGQDYTITGFAIVMVVAPPSGTNFLSFYLYTPVNPVNPSPSTNAYSITVSQLKADIARMMKGTALTEITDFYSTAMAAANRMLARLDTEETRRIVTLTCPFYDNIYDYALVSDYKRMIDIRPQVNRYRVVGRSNFSETSAKQFDLEKSADSFSIQWNNMIRTLRARQYPIGNVALLDPLTGPTSNGTWTPTGDAGGLYTEILNYVYGNSSLGFNLSGGTGNASIVNSTAAVVDLSALLFRDSSVYALFIPAGSSYRFLNLSLSRGSSASNYITASTSTKLDGTALSDGWNLVKFDWISAVITGTPDNTKNTYRQIAFTYTPGTQIQGVLVNNWTDALGNLYEIEYYSNFLFRTAVGAWEAAPTSDTDLVNVSQTSYEILKTEMMIDITKEIRTGEVQAAELTDWRLMLNGTPASRYVKDPPYHGLYQDYIKMYPSSAIPTITRTYSFDV